MIFLRPRPRLKSFPRSHIFLYFLLLFLLLLLYLLLVLVLYLFILFPSSSTTPFSITSLHLFTAPASAQENKVDTKTAEVRFLFCGLILWLVGKGQTVSAQSFFPLFFFSVCPIPRFSNPWHIRSRLAHKRSVGRSPGSTALIHDKKCHKTKATSTNLSWQHYANHAPLSQSNCPICNQSEYTISSQSECTSFSSQSQHSLSR